MKNVTIFILLLVLLTIINCTKTVDIEADKEAVRKAWEESVVAFNNHDFEAWRRYIAEDYEGWGGGRQAFEKSYKNLFDTQKGAQYKRLDEIGITFLTPTVAIYKSRGEMSGLIDDDGNPVPPSKTLGAWIWVKKNGKWLCSAFFSR